MRKTLELPYAPAQMFCLVDRVEEYPLFLPWCTKSHIHHRNTEQVQASLQVGKGPIRYTLTTLNHRQPDTRIDLQLIAGPFKHLEGTWHFEKSPTGSRVSLSLSFELNALLYRALEPYLEGIGDRVMRAFCERAALLYGIP